jgi:hypothetical protein
VSLPLTAEKEIVLRILPLQREACYLLFEEDTLFKQQVDATYPLNKMELQGAFFAKDLLCQYYVIEERKIS